MGKRIGDNPINPIQHIRSRKIYKDRQLYESMINHPMSIHIKLAPIWNDLYIRAVSSTLSIHYARVHATDVVIKMLDEMQQIQSVAISSMKAGSNS